MLSNSTDGREHHAVWSRYGEKIRSATPQLGVEDIAQRVAEEIGAKHGRADEDARENGHPGRRLKEAHSF